jgi:hypothetical protein
MANHRDCVGKATVTNHRDCVGKAQECVDKATMEEESLAAVVVLGSKRPSLAVAPSLLEDFVEFCVPANHVPSTCPARRKAQEMPSMLLLMTAAVILERQCSRK